jgi:hypothetical protein
VVNPSVEGAGFDGRCVAEGPERGVRVRVIDAKGGRPGDDAGVQKRGVVGARVAVSGTFDNT